MNTKDTAYKIFNSLFLCIVQCMPSMSDEELDEYGILYLNDPEYDDFIQNQWIHRYLTINQMVELHRRGVDVIVKNKADTKKIYEYIRDHLLAWEHFISNGLNVSAAPYDDLIELDKFASKVYPFAKKEYGSIFSKSDLITKMRTTSLVPIAEPKLQSSNLNQEESKEEDDGYQSMTELFANKKSSYY